MQAAVPSKIMEEEEEEKVVSQPSAATLDNAFP